MKINIRVFDAGESVVYQHLETGKIQLVHNNSVISEATPNRPVNYNRIVRRITSYLSSYVEGTTDTVVEDNVILPQEI